MKQTVVGVLLCSALALAGCAGVTTLHEADNGRAIALNVGDALVVLLHGNASTGYVWLRTGTLDVATLSPASEGTYQSDGTAPGSPGTFAFRYLATAPGRTTLDLVYKRPWESEILSAFSVSVVVH